MTAVPATSLYAALLALLLGFVATLLGSRSAVRAQESAG